MKRRFQFFARGASKTRFGICLGVCFLAAGQLSNGAPLKSARVSAVIRDVRLLPSNAAPRPAAVNENVGLGTAVRTGTESRAELTFADLTVTRLGQNTIFSFNEAARELNVTKGAILVEVPPKAPAAKITTAGVTAGVMGATALFATGPPTKFMMLEGIGTFYPTGHPERTVTVHAGEMVMMTADGRITQPTKFNVQLVLQTSHLIIDFPALANLPLILQVINQQLAEQSAGTANPLPSKDSVVDVIDVLSQNVTANPSVLATPVVPGLPVISSSVPYVINNGTVIATHIPTITTNGVTDHGVIYHGRTIDGPLSAFLFGSTSAFDTASGFDTVISGGGGNGLGGRGTGAGFKFTSLELAGDPTVDTANGQINLGLVGVKGITSGAPGGTLTFAGIRGLLLATQKGSINLGSEISFSGFHDLNIYARGASSDLTLGSDISTTSHVDLFAERDLSLTSTITTDKLYAFVGRNVTISGESAVINAPTITLSAGQDLTWKGQTSDETAVNSDGDVTISAGQAINIASDLSITRHNGGAGSGLNLSLSAGTDLTVGGSLTLAVANSAAASLIDTGGNIALTTGGNLTVNGANGINLSVTNTGETINNGGNINLMVGATTTIPTAVATATTQAVELFVDSSGLGTIGTGGNVTFQTVGAVMLNAALGMEVDTYNGGSINNGANVTAHFGGDVTLTAGQFHSLNFFLVNGSAQAGELGGTIGTGGNINVTFDHNVQTNGTSANGALAAAIFNDGGSITTGGNISASIAGNLSAGNVLEGFITNDHGTIGTGGNITFHIAGDVTEAGHTFFQLFNQGGTIHSGPVIDFSARSLTVTGSTSFMQIDNTNGGNIGGNAAVNFGLIGNLMTAGNATFSISNNGGIIGGDATLTINAGSISTAGNFFEAINNTGGTIGGKATVNVNVSGSANVTNNATFQILGSNSAAGAAINFNGGNYGVGGTFFGAIDGNGAITFNNASLHADTVKVGVFGTNGTLTIGGGAISANTLLKLYAPGSNGIIDFVANVTLSNQASAVLIAANKVIIANGVVVTIGGSGGPASVFTNIANYTGSGGNGSTTGVFGGNGARTSPLSSAPPFGAAPSSSANVSQQPAQGGVQGERTTGNDGVPASNRSNRPLHRPLTTGTMPASDRIRTGGNTAVINVANSGQLLDLLDSAALAPGGKITIPASNRTTHSKNSSRINADSRLKADGRADNPRLLASARSFAP